MVLVLKQNSTGIPLVKFFYADDLKNFLVSTYNFLISKIQTANLVFKIFLSVGLVNLINYGHS